MSKPKFHIPGLPKQLYDYAQSRALEFHLYSQYHMRLMDGGFTVLDIWTTGKYYVLATDYLEMLGPRMAIERGGEKGLIPDRYSMHDWLDELFFPEKLDNPVDKPLDNNE